MTDDELGRRIVERALLEGDFVLRSGARSTWYLDKYRFETEPELLRALAAVGGILMNVAFHLANGSAHPWLIPADGFDEGVDLDSLMPAIQIVLAAVSAGMWLRLRRERQTVSLTAARQLPRV